MKQAELFGYQFDAYDFGGLGFGEPYSIHHWNLAGERVEGPIHEKNRGLVTNNKGLVTGTGAFPTKQDFIYDHWKKVDDFIVYLDADAMVTQNIDEAIGDYDIGVTMRASYPKVPDVYLPFREFCHAGVVFVNNTEGAEIFLQRWIAARDVAYTYSDQHALDITLRSELRDFGYPLRGKTVTSLSGIKIKILPQEIYNLLVNRNTFNPDAKIVHISGDLKMKQRVHNESFLKSLEKCRS